MPTDTISIAAWGAISWVEIIAALTIPASFLAVIVHRVRSGMGMGIRSIQFLAMGTVMPTVLILALEDKIAGEAVAAIVGGVVGYLFTSASQTKKANEANDVNRT